MRDSLGSPAVCSPHMIIRTSLRLAATFAFQAACGPSLRTNPVSSPCADTSWRSQNLLRTIHDMVTAADSEGHATRAVYQLDSGASLALIRDERICAQAAAAYSTLDADTGHRPRQRRVFVVRINDKYAVDDPYTPARAGEFEVWAIFDRRWRLVAAIVD